MVNYAILILYDFQQFCIKILVQLYNDEIKSELKNELNIFIHLNMKKQYNKRNIRIFSKSKKKKNIKVLDDELDTQIDSYPNTIESKYY